MLNVLMPQIILNGPGIMPLRRQVIAAICAELAGETISLRDIIQARNRRRRDLRHTLQERSRLVETLLEARRDDSHADEPTETNDPAMTLEKPPERAGSPPLKRYFNE